MMSPSESEQDPTIDMGIGSGDANDMQRAIRARALHTIQRRPTKFWYSSPPRLIAAVALAIVSLVVLGFGIDRCLRAFHMLLSVYASQQRSAPAPATQEPAVFFVQPDPTLVVPPAESQANPPTAQ